jgi:hypothetical protein
MRISFNDIKTLFSTAALLCALQVCAGAATWVAAQSPGSSSNSFTLTKQNGFDISVPLNGLNTTGRVTLKVKMRTALPLCVPNPDGTFIKVKLELKKGTTTVGTPKTVNVNNVEREYTLTHDITAEDFNNSGSWKVLIGKNDINERDMCGSYAVTFPTTTGLLTVHPGSLISLGPGDFRDFTFNMPNDPERGKVKVIVTWHVLGIPAALSAKLLKPSGSSADSGNDDDGSLSFTYDVKSSDPVLQAWKVQVKNNSLLPINDIKVKVEYTPN